MSAQDARVVDAIRKGIDTGTSALRSLLGDAVYGDEIDIGWKIIGPDVSTAIEKAILATLDAVGIVTGHVQINGGSEATVGFEVLPQDKETEG